MMWLALLGLLIGPFIQEDLAVIGAASLSLTLPDYTLLIFALIFIGLFASDIWKYWPGYLARKRGSGIDSLKRPRLAKLVTKLRAHPGKTLMTVRFIPFARIAAYLAAGYAHVPYWRFCFWVAVSAVLYIGVVFTLFHVLGAALGEQVKLYMPLIGVIFAIILLGGAWLSGRRSPPKPE